MALISDILLILGAVAATIYCIILSKRLQNFKDLDKGIGGAVSVLSSQVETLTQALNQAQTTADQSNSSLADLTQRAETVSQRLELLMASMHDLPSPQPQPEQKSQPLFSRRAPATDTDSAA